MIDVERTIISQYGNSATVTQLVRDMNAYLDPRADFEAFFNFVWNVDTAQGFGLDVWGRIVNISRLLTVPQDLNNFGFTEGLGTKPFNEAPFYDGTPAATSTYKLSDAAYRKLILVKALANISVATAPAINQLLQNLFGNDVRTVASYTYTPLDNFVLDQDQLGYTYGTTQVEGGRCYVNDMGNMRLRYTFEFNLEPWELAIVLNSETLPRPAGVDVILFQSPLPVFGFSEAGESSAPFGEGVFYS